MSLIKGETGDWEIVLGLEVHAQVISEAKLFSGAPTTFGADPNTQVSLVDAAMPGMLPVINERCVEQAVRTGLGLNAQIHLRSVFDRKNYFYADLPAGYQISQFKDPIVGEGVVEIDLPDGTTKNIGIERLHLEQDAGKSLHDQHPSQTYVDLNRSGVALMEIVSRPDMRNADMVMRQARQLLPGLKGEPASKWMGPRPSHPDSKPVIGRSPRHRNVFFAFGHDHLGLTMAGITGKLIAELATGKPTTVDLAPFRPDRF